MHKKFEVNWTKIKGGCQSGRKVSQLNSYSKMPLDGGSKKGLVAYLLRSPKPLPADLKNRTYELAQI